jgi:hypothetical protein
MYQEIHPPKVPPDPAPPSLALQSHSHEKLDSDSSLPPSPYPLPYHPSSENNTAIELTSAEAEYFASQSSTPIPRSTIPTSSSSSSQLKDSLLDQGVIRRSSETSAHCQQHGGGGPGRRHTESLPIDSFFEQERHNSKMEKLANRYRTEGMGVVEDWSHSCWPRGPGVRMQREVYRRREGVENGKERKLAKSSVHFAT